MVKNKHATDPRNGIQIAASCSSEILKTIYWPMSTKLKRLFPKLNNAPTQRTQKIVKMAPFPTFSLIISFEYMHDKDNEYALNMYLWSKSSFSCGNRSRAAFFDVSLGNDICQVRLWKRCDQATIGDKISWDTSRKKTSHEHGFICSYLKRCEIPFNGTLSPLPLFSGQKFVGTQRRPNNVKGEGWGTLSQGSSKHLFLGKCLNNFVANCLNNKIDNRVSKKVTRCGLLAIISAKHAGY